MKQKYISLGVLILSAITFVFSLANLIKQSILELTPVGIYIFGLIASILIVLLCTANFLAILHQEKKAKKSDTDSIDSDNSEDSDTTSDDKDISEEAEDNFDDACADTEETESDDDDIDISLSDIDKSVNNED